MSSVDSHCCFYVSFLNSCNSASFKPADYSSHTSANTQSAMATPSAVVSIGADITSRPFSFTNVLGEKLIGTIDSLDSATATAAAAADPSSSPTPSNRCALLCHGMLSNRNEFFLPALSAALLQRCPRQVQHVCRFDFGGMGESEGVFEYGGYDRLTSEMLSAMSALRSKGLEVTHLLGHSMSGSGVLLFASRYSLVPHVVSIAPRYDMLSDFRFGKDDLLQLVRDGVMYLRARGRANPVPVSIETYRERLRLDMSCVRRIGRLPREGEGGAGDSSRPVHTLLLHGTEDEVIPLSDAYHLHQWMVAEKALDGPGFEWMDQAARDCTCAVVEPATSDTQQLQAQGGAEPKLAPAMSASMAHTLVPVPGANHCFNKPANAADLLCQTVCAWVNLHDCEQLCARAAAEPLPVDQYALRLRAATDAPAASADSGAKL